MHIILYALQVNYQEDSKDYLKESANSSIELPPASRNFNILMNQNSANSYNYFMQKITLITMHISEPWDEASVATYSIQTAHIETYIVICK